MKLSRMFLSGVDSFVGKTQKRSWKIKCSTLCLFLASYLLLGELSGITENTGFAKYGESEHQSEIEQFLRMEPEVMIRTIRMIGRDKFFDIARNLDPYSFARAVREMDSNKIVRLFNLLVNDPSLRNPRFVESRKSGSGWEKGSYGVMGVSAMAGSSALSSEAWERLLSGGHLAVIIHPSNSAIELTASELRDVFSGKIQNWSQLGGPNLPVEVMAAGIDLDRNPPDGRKSFSGLSTPFSSVVMAGVAESRGALGVVRTNNPAQAAFLQTHQAVKRIAIK